MFLLDLLLPDKDKQTPFISRYKVLSCFFPLGSPLPSDLQMIVSEKWGKLLWKVFENYLEKHCQIALYVPTAQRNIWVYFHKHIHPKTRMSGERKQISLNSFDLFYAEKWATNFTELNLIQTKVSLIYEADECCLLCILWFIDC